MAALATKVATLQLELEDRNKAAELLTKLLSDQAKRNQEERTSLQNEQTVAQEQLTTDCKIKEKELADSTNALQRRRGDLEQKIKELLSKRKAADLRKKSNTENLRQQIQSTKEEAHTKFKEEKANREKLWQVRRAKEITELTWKSIQPNIERLNRKHRERCDDIQSQMKFTKHKLEMQSEQALADRVQAFRADMERCHSEVEGLNGIARKTADHQAACHHLREEVGKEEKAIQSLHELALDTLRQENKAELVSLQAAPNMEERFAQELKLAAVQKRKDLATRVESIRSELEKARVRFEADWKKKADDRMEKKMQKYSQELVTWRKREIDVLLRQSVIDEENYTPPVQNDSVQEKISSMTDHLRFQLERNDMLKCKVVALEKKNDRSKEDLAVAEECLCEATSRLQDVTKQLARKEERMKDGLVRRTQEKIESITLERLDIETEIAEVKKKQAEEEAMHRSLMNSLRADHEAKLGALQVRASEKVQTYDRKIRQVQSTAMEQRAVLDQAQILLDSRYVALLSYFPKFFYTSTSISDTTLRPLIPF